MVAMHGRPIDGLDRGHFESGPPLSWIRKYGQLGVKHGRVEHAKNENGAGEHNENCAKLPYSHGALRAYRNATLTRLVIGLNPSSLRSEKVAAE